MTATIKLVPVQAAYDDLLQRTLSKITCDLAKLIYLASTRDYNTGTYHHDGLAARFRPEVAGKALEIAHRQIFYQLAESLHASSRSSHDDDISCGHTTNTFLFSGFSLWCER